MAVVASNPILPGFYPDPSACVVGDDIYIVNSSFAYFPGLPVLHSKDLAHWEQIGNVLNRNEQLPLGEAEVSQGLFAPTIRYHEGVYYVICTNVSFGGNFIVTATSPEGPWSEPHFIEGADGIDPSLFFDEDGKCYYTGTHPNPEGCKYDGDWYIYIQELDIKNFKLVGEKHNVWNGAMKGVHWPEGPHLYHIGTYYYILHAEGGTGPEHAISVARSKTVFGPYENNFCNPIFTHRHLGTRYPVRYVGHGDMFQVANGDWYMIMLAVRQIKGFTTLGRETFLARVVWENGWPVVNANLGVLSEKLNVNLPEWEPEYSQNALPGMDKYYDFTKYRKLGNEWMFLRNPSEDIYNLTLKPEANELGEHPVNSEFRPGLNLKCGKHITGKKDVTYLSIRQDSHMFEAKTILYEDNLCTGASAGIMLFQNNRFNLRFEVSNWIGYIIMCKDGQDEKIGSVRLNGSYVGIILRVVGLKASFLVRKFGEKHFSEVIEDIDISDLSTEVAGGFVGCTVGLYAQDVEKNREKAVYANFSSFSYDKLVALNTDEDEN